VLTVHNYRCRLHGGSAKNAPVYPQYNRVKSVILPRYYFAPGYNFDNSLFLHQNGENCCSSRRFRIQNSSEFFCSEAVPRIQLGELSQTPSQLERETYLPFLTHSVLLNRSTPSAFQFSGSLLFGASTLGASIRCPVLIVKSRRLQQCIII